MAYEIANLIQDVLDALGKIIAHERTPPRTRKHASLMMLFASESGWPITDDSHVTRAREVFQEGSQTGLSR